MKFDMAATCKDENACTKQFFFKFEIHKNAGENIF